MLEASKVLLSYTPYLELADRSHAYESEEPTPVNHGDRLQTRSFLLLHTTTTTATIPSHCHGYSYTSADRSTLRHNM